MSKKISPSKITPKDFVKELVKNGLGPVIEVPCSYLKDFLNYLEDHSDAMRVINPVNEAIVMGIASGEYLGSGKLPVIAIQNSGLMNTLNALTSLNQIYEIPVFMMITWRGEGGKGKDAPEHDITGANLEKILKTFDLPYEIADGEKYKEQVKNLTEIAKKTNKPVAFIIRKNTFESYVLDKKLQQKSFEMSRFEAIRIIKELAEDKAVFVSGTGYPTRDSFNVKDTPDFYMVGSMGHVFSVGLGLSSHTEKKVIVLDGDGGALMHAGGMASLGKETDKNIIYIVLDNEVYESTGNQPSVSKQVNFIKLAEAFGFKNNFEVLNSSDLKKATFSALNSNVASFIHVKVRIEEGAGKRVSEVYSAPQIKNRFMKNIKNRA